MLKNLLELLNAAVGFIIDGIKIIHKEGYVFVVIGLIATIIGFAILDVLGFIFLTITTWCIYFFRDPERIPPADTSSIIAPADGIITEITKATTPPELSMPEEEFTRVSIFLNVFDVHVNRIPIFGKIERICYIPGKFFNANLDKSSTENERNIVVLNSNGTRFIVTQIAGLIARRIVCYLKEGQEVQTGERYGIIRFGSRVDIFVPKNLEVLVQKGQRMLGGETVIAKTKP